MIGETLAGRFRITGPPLGEGESGVVHPALDVETGREVVVKLLHEHLVADPQALARLEAEAGLAGRLSHAHIVEVLGLWSSDGRWFLAAERVEGPSLAQVDGALAPEAVIALGLQLCDALAAAHERNLIHGDLRPGNVLLGPHGASLFDFGVAHLAREGQHLVRPGQTAPEVASGATPRVAADLYGLGVVLYRAMTGKLPFQEASPFATLAAQRDRAPRPPGPAGLGRLVQELLDPEPARRPPDVAAVTTVLRKLQRRPERIVRTPRRWIAPVRPFRAWMVHGIDPTTGARASVRVALGKGRARELTERLRGEGWDVAMAKEALSVGDLVWVGILIAVFGVAVPVVGVLLGAALGLVWRSSSTQPRLREVLPPVRAPVPPRSAPAGAEYLIAAGIALLVAAALLLIKPWLALAPLLLVALIARSAWKSRALTPEERALHARIATVLAEARAGIEARAHGLDRALSLQGELEELEHGWHTGQVPQREVLLRAEALQEQATSAARREDSMTAATLEALRRTGVQQQS